MEKDIVRCAQRAVGRLFSEGGRLHLVLEADPVSGVAKVSCRVDETTQVVAMPLVDVLQRLSAKDVLKLDGLSSERADARVVHRDRRWFFRAREGEIGPFSDAQSAKRALTRHVLRAQEDGRTARPARAPSR